jgi:hypothetical protein
MPERKYYVYMIASIARLLYTGMTNNLEKPPGWRLSRLYVELP